MAAAKKIKGTHGGKRAGSGSQPKGAEVMIVKSVRLTPTQATLFEKWGGVERLRKALDYFQRATKAA